MRCLSSAVRTGHIYYSLFAVVSLGPKFAQGHELSVIEGCLSSHRAGTMKMLKGWMDG